VYNNHLRPFLSFVADTGPDRSSSDLQEPSGWVKKARISTRMRRRACASFRYALPTFFSAEISVSARVTQVQRRGITL